ncbi:MAG: RNA polymerase sigma factor [Acidimicrobiales bacterium]
MISGEDDFKRFVEEVEPRLHRALVAHYGWEAGREAAAEALAYAWEHRSRVLGMDNPAGYLFRVGQSAARRLDGTGLLFEPQETPEPWVEPRLGPLLAALSERQRVAVVLIHGYGWSAAEVAELIGVSRNTVLSHLERGLRQLRSQLEVNHAELG